MDNEELIKLIKENDPHVLILGFCYTNISELNTTLRSKGLYADMIIRKDLSNISGVNKGKLIQFDPAQQKILDEYLDKMPKSVVLVGHYGAGKTLMTTQILGKGLSI